MDQKTKLAELLASGVDCIDVNTRKFKVEGISQDGDIAVATLTTPCSSYTAVMCPKHSVAGKPGAEVWSVIGTRREVARFAIHDGRVHGLYMA